MNEYVEKRCEELKVELGALHQRMQLMESKQAESGKRTGSVAGWRCGRTMLIFCIPLVGLLAAVGLLYGQGGGDAMFIDAMGKVGIGTAAPKAQLDVQQEPRTDPHHHPDSVKVLYVTGGLGENSGIEFRHSNGSQGIGFGYNTIYATGSNSDQDLNLKPRGTGRVRVQGVLEGIGALPRGVIVMWSGDPARLPVGWVLCDGSSGTPDLRSRFVVGYDSRVADYNQVQKVGGLDKVALTQVELGNHTHSVKRGGSTVGTHKHGGLTTTVNANIPIYGPATEEATQTTSAVPHENRPPFMTLAYIMYTGETRQ